MYDQAGEVVVLSGFLSQNIAAIELIEVCIGDCCPAIQSNHENSGCWVYRVFDTGIVGMLLVSSVLLPKYKPTLLQCRLF